jgi:L-ascorbate metabolism protein UlaG (beta-lactamase superfamily)
MLVYWLLGLLGVSLLGLLFRVRGWVYYLIRQRRRDRKFPLTEPRHRPKPSEWRDDAVTISWLGHATLLINFFGKYILTDPVFSDRVGLRLPGGSSLGPRRLVRSPLAAAELPPLDLILQSHAHMDHLDLQSWKQLRRGPAVVMAPNNARYIRGLGFAPVTELRWGDTLAVAGIKVTAIEVKHWGHRFPWSRDHGYNAYLLERNGHAILFGGDTAYTDSLRRACEGRRIDVAILPIGGYFPYIHMHASPEQAWKMFRDLGAGFLAPVHHQTFILSYEPPPEPLQRLLAAAGDDAGRVVIREVGESFALRDWEAR